MQVYTALQRRNVLAMNIHFLSESVREVRLSVRCGA
jgi:hypothetical protein